MIPTSARTACAAAAAVAFAIAVRSDGLAVLPFLATALAWMAIRNEARPLRAGAHAALFALGLGSIAATPLAALSPWVSIPAAIAASVPFAAAGWIAARCARYGAGAAVAFVAIWIAIEAVAGARVWGERALPMLSIGLALVDGPWLPTARWSGAHGMTLLLWSGGILSAETLAAILERRRRAGALSRTALGAVALLVLLIGAATPGTTPPDVSLRIRMVQPALGEREQAASRMVPALRAARLARLGEASRAADRIVLWPEGALPEPIAWPPTRGRPSALPAGGEVLLGAATRREDGLYNSALLWHGHELRHVADKRMRVPVMEAHLRAGVPRPPFQWAGRLWSVLICWDAVHPSLAREAVREGAEVLAVLANDAFDPLGPSASLHLRMARLRAAESGVPVAFASQAGPSALIDARGRVTADLPQGRRGTLDARLSAGTRVTPYRRHGDVVGRWALLLALPCAGLAALGRRPASAGRGVIG